jgi:hypothetical protein
MIDVQFWQGAQGLVWISEMNLLAINKDVYICNTSFHVDTEAGGKVPQLLNGATEGRGNRRESVQS